MIKVIAYSKIWASCFGRVKVTLHIIVTYLSLNYCTLKECNLWHKQRVICHICLFLLHIFNFKKSNLKKRKIMVATHMIISCSSFNWREFGQSGCCFHCIKTICMLIYTYWIHVVFNSNSQTADDGAAFSVHSLCPCSCRVSPLMQIFISMLERQAYLEKVI